MISHTLSNLSRMIEEENASFRFTVYLSNNVHEVISIYDEETYDGMVLDVKTLSWVYMQLPKHMDIYAHLVKLALRMGVVFDEPEKQDVFTRIQMKRHDTYARWVLERWRVLIQKRQQLRRAVWDVWMMRAARPDEGRLYAYWNRQFQSHLLTTI
jgi:hypothetical protein